jgi:thioredoxin
MEKNWKIKVGGKVYGPKSASEIKKLLEGKKVAEDTEISDAETLQWKKIYEVEDFNFFWKVKIEEKVYGLFSTETVSSMIIQKRIPKDALVKHPQEHMAWKLIGDVEEFKKVFEQGPGKLKCKQCGTINERNAEFCSLCQAPFRQKAEHPCPDHPYNEASVKCESCRRVFCKECVISEQGPPMCRECRELSKERSKDRKFYDMTMGEKIKEQIIHPVRFYEALPMEGGVEEAIRFQQSAAFFVLALSLIMMVFTGGLAGILISIIIGGIALLIIKFLLGFIIKLFNYIPYFVLKLFGGRGTYDRTLTMLCYYSGSMSIVTMTFQAVVTVLLGIIFFLANYVSFLVILGVAINVLTVIIIILLSLWELYIIFAGIRAVHEFSGLVAGILVFGPPVFLFLLALAIFGTSVPEIMSMSKKMKEPAVESVKQIQGEVIRRKGTRRKKWKFVVGEETELQGTVKKLDHMDYDEKVFTKAVLFEEQQDTYLIVTDNGQVESALKYVLAEGYYVLMTGRKLEEKKGKIPEGAYAVYCDGISFKGMKFGDYEYAQLDDGAGTTSDYEAVPVIMDSSNYDEIIQKSYEMPVLMDFSADWCHWCKVLEPTFNKMAQEMKSEVLFVRIDADTNKDIAGKYSVRGLPTMVLVKNGKALKTQSGAGRNEMENRALIGMVISSAYSK